MALQSLSSLRLLMPLRVLRIVRVVLAKAPRRAGRVEMQRVPVKRAELPTRGRKSSGKKMKTDAKESLSQA